MNDSEKQQNPVAAKGPAAESGSFSSIEKTGSGCFMLTSPGLKECFTLNAKALS